VVGHGLVVLYSHFARHNMIRFLALLLDKCLFQILLRQLLIAVEITGKIGVVEIKGRVRRRNDMVRNFVRSLGQEASNLI
jgi:archaellum biogenesis protein FlaJ (TadC family)